jgi:predicted nucleotide-binding protein (sugar kinase/HSP70/actin superfamily)
MPIRQHRCLKPRLDPRHPLAGKVIYIPAMAEGSVEAFASIFRWMGIEAHPTPPSDARTRELGARLTSGDECYPAQVTMGDFARIMEQPGFDPARTIFFMATADGPCRFGQYAPFLRRALRQAGYGELTIISPATERGYSEIAALGTAFQRTAWRVLVSADLLRKRLLQTRPYETSPGATDRAFRESVQDLCLTIESACVDPDCQLTGFIASLERARSRFHSVPADYHKDLPLIGVVGEIFCRLNTFSNQDIVRKLEKQGAEAWLSNIAEWICYCNDEEQRKLRLCHATWSRRMLRSLLRGYVQRSDEHKLVAVFHDDFLGCEEPAGIREVLDLARPYLPNTGVEGEMVLSVGRAAYLARKGADGILDVSPFTCMNGIVSEAIYPRLSKNYGGIPIRNFYFDGTQSSLENDLGIYLELARSYRRRKQFPRHYPARFQTRAA